MFVGYSEHATPDSKLKNGEVPEWPKGADCKSAGAAYGGSNPPLSTSEFKIEDFRFKKRSKKSKIQNLE